MMGRPRKRTRDADGTADTSHLEPTEQSRSIGEVGVGAMDFSGEGHSAGTYSRLPLRSWTNGSLITRATYR